MSETCIYNLSSFSFRGGGIVHLQIGLSIYPILTCADVAAESLSFTRFYGRCGRCLGVEFEHDASIPHPMGSARCHASLGRARGGPEQDAQIKRKDELGPGTADVGALCGRTQRGRLGARARSRRRASQLAG